MTAYETHLTFAELPPKFEEDCVLSRITDFADTTLLHVDVAFPLVPTVVDD